MITFVSIFLFAFIRCFSAELLVFEPQAGVEPVMNNYLTNNYPTLNLNAAADFHRYVYISMIKDYVHNFKYECKIRPTDQAINSAKFCCKNDLNEEETCHELQIGDSKVSCGKIEFDYSFNSRDGVTFKKEFRKPAPTEDPTEFKGLISCTLERAGHKIESNEIEFRDATFYIRQLNLVTELRKVVRVADLSRLDVPKDFPCLSKEDHLKIASWPSWMRIIMSESPPFEYFYCAVSSSSAEKINPASCYQNRAKIPTSEAVKETDGILYVTSASFFTEPRAIICVDSDKGMSLNAFAGDFDDSSGFFTAGIPRPTNISKREYSLKAISPTNQLVEVVSGAKLNNFALTALYESPEGGVTFKWYRNSNELENKNPYALRLSRKMADKTVEGEYKLLVTSVQDSSQKLEFVLNLVLVGPPQFDDPDCLKKLTYVAEGETLARSCALNKKADQVLFGIDGYEDDQLSSLQEQIRQGPGIQNPAMVDLSHNLHMGVYNEGLTTEITVKDLSPGQDFRVTIEARNQHGKSLVGGNVKIVPKPKLVASLSNFDCNDHCDLRPVTFTAELDLAFEKSLADDFGIQVVKDWLINNRYSTEYFQANESVWRFVIFNTSSPNEITISPRAIGLPPIPVEEVKAEEEEIMEDDLQTGSHARSSADDQDINRGAEVMFAFQPFSRRRRSVDSTTEEGRLDIPPVFPKGKENPDTLKEFLELSKEPALRVSRRIRYYVVNRAYVSIVRNPAILDPKPELKNQLELEGAQLIYDSRLEKDPYMKNQLEAVRSFSTPPMVASANWIIVVVLISILVLLVVAVLIAGLCLRNKKSTYKVRKEEQAKGYDPDQEIKNQHNTLLYVTPQEKISLMPQNGIHSDEDGELDDYRGENPRSSKKGKGKHIMV